MFDKTKKRGFREDVIVNRIGTVNWNIIRLPFFIVGHKLYIINKS